MNGYKKRILILTDCADIALNEILSSLNKELRELGAEDRVVVDAPVVVANFSIANAAFCIRLMADYYTKGDILLVIANATNKGPERIIATTSSGITLVGNNSGYFGWLADAAGIEMVYRNRIDRIVDHRSFGGKYVQVPTAARLIAGLPIAQLGEPMEKLELVRWLPTRGEVVHIDNFGLTKLYSDAPFDPVEGGSYHISVNSTYLQTAVGTRKMKFWPDGTLVLFPGSSLGGLPELACVRHPNTAAALGLKLGDVITWTLE